MGLQAPTKGSGKENAPQYALETSPDHLEGRNETC